VKPPGLDTRRTPEFSAELRERARAWIPSWALAEGERDFGRALLDIAARFSSEVAERLDRAGEKMRGGFLDWLAVRGQAARPARMPVVFKLADAAREPVLATAPIRMQVDAAGASVIFETEKDVRLLPGSLQTVVGVDAEADAVYLPPPGLSDLNPLESLPTQWQLKSFASAGATTLQVDPETGLAVGTVLEAAGQQYRIEKVDNEIITVDPPLTSALEALTILRKVTAFAPFDRKTRNRQEHALYLGHKDLLDIESPATIAVSGAQILRESVKWDYWGKVGMEEEPGWRKLSLAPDADQEPGAVVLQKPKGAVEPREIAGKSSRWIRALTKNVPPTQPPFQSDELALGINPFKCKDPNAFPPIEQVESIAAEGMANTQPLVLESVFYPLGREPRQFDAFYLGSKEAFSKSGARVQLNFQMGDPSFESLAYLRSGPWRQWIFAGVAGDGLLYLLYLSALTGQLTRDDRGPLRPPSPGPGGVAVEEPAIQLDARPGYRAAMWSETDAVNVAVAAGDTVWVWRNVWPDPPTSGWFNFGSITEDIAVSTAPITGIVHLEDGSKGQLFALREGKLYQRDLNATNQTWELLETKDGANPVALQTIVPIAVQDPSTGDVLAGTLAKGLVGVGDDKKLYAVEFGVPSLGDCTELRANVDPEILPAAVFRSDDRLLAVAVNDDPLDRHLLAFRSQPNDYTTGVTDDEPLPSLALIGRSIDVNLSSGVLAFALTLQDAVQSTALALWTPFVSPLDLPSISAIPTSAGFAGGSPTLLPSHVIVPAMSSQLLVAPFSVSNLLTFNVPLTSAVIASTAADQLQAGDNVAIPFDDNGTVRYQLQNVIPPPITVGGETLYAFNVPSVKETLYVSRAPVTVYASTAAAPLNQLVLDPADNDTVPGSILLITTDKSTDVYEVMNPVNVTTVALDKPLDVNVVNTPLAYQAVEESGARLAPLMQLTAANNNWQASLLGRTFLVFPDGNPRLQRGKAFDVDPNTGKPILVALGDHWLIGDVPVDTGSGAKFLVDATVGDWTAQLGDTSSNPALSWEYGNGTGWWKLDPIQDETLNLKRTGNVRFTIPADLRPMDWAGRMNHWIRARLVGGDYGREIVTIKNITGGQTIERSTAGIRPPSVVKLHIAYKLCKHTRPDFVYAKDSGSMRDQSDANRTRGAIVEAFVPLAMTLGRLNDPAAVEDPAEECPPCQCPPETTTTTGAPAPAATTTQPAAAPRLAMGRALFVGLNATPSGVPVNVLLLVDKEAKHEQFAPMKIEALAADRFLPIVAEDTTRALGESGLLSMDFAVEPTPRELFGMENLTWLRLTPGGDGPSSEWTPTLRGAYLNAVWASAAETLTRELLGSSEGAPNLTVRLARPPVLRDSLELRVKEPLGEEERQKLREGDENRVLSNVEGLVLGDWVLWNRVTDPGDADPGERVYALDESNGEIRFGDGQHGMIPPIDRDSIVAFTYRRTEIGGSEGNDVPGNSLTARTALNLVSPVDSVEAVFAADRAAGGAPPERAERVVRFGTARLRHRNRAVTARDFEDLALESSPDIVQARCFVRPGRVRLVVVMRGENSQPDAAEVRELERPQPYAAEVRELKRLLLAAAPAALSAPDALRIEGPRVRRLRIVLGLRVASLDHAGQVSTDVQKRIKALFDTATGGVSGEGWALGAEPSEEDIALALLPIRRLEGLGDVTLREVLADSVERPWTGAVRRDELVLLDKDAVRLELKTVEVIA
jgi:hypothetical protein